MSRQGRQPLGRAESEKDEAHGGVLTLFVHLDQVLLAGQSMPVPHQHQDMDAVEAAQVTC